MGNALAYHYYSRPALRNQWIAVGIALVLMAVFVVVSFRGLVIGMTEFGIAAVIGVGVLLLSLCIPIAIRKYSWLYSIDDENIESRYGIISLNVKSIRIKDLRNINVRQSFFQRIFTLGDVEFSTAAGGGVEVVFAGVLDPMSVKYVAQSLQDSYDRRRANAYRSLEENSR
ncbi:MAG TPA: hypothetical protein DCO77_06880 [Nitrospiraceae bacterium]|nr:hypothetical protein [Nitrospiraceae bacterium]